ncbi:MAG: ABC transporter ATP-binding protein [Acidimicrobiales bacterium]
MLQTLYRLLPDADAKRLRQLVTWLTAAAVLQGVTLGFAGIAIAAVLDNRTTPVGWLVALSASAVAFLVVQWLAQQRAFHIGASTARTLHLRLGDHLAELPLGWFTPARQAEAVATATGGVPQLMSFPALLLRPAITAAVTPPAAAVTLAVLDWRYSIAVLVACAVAWFVARYSARLAGTVDERRHRTATEATSRVLEYADRQPIIRTDARPDDDDLGQALDEVRRTSRRSAGTVIPGLVLFGFTLNALLAILIGVAVVLLAVDEPEIGAFVGVVVVVVRLAGVAATGAELSAGLRMQAGALERFAGLVDAPPLPQEPKAADTSGEPAGPIGDETPLAKLDNVSFGYDGTPVLTQVSMEVPRRGVTALVGPSGAGKTTIVRLLARFWDPDAGTIILDGADLRTFPSDELYEYVATVLQDDHLLDRSIGENILLGRPDATPEEVDAAVRGAGLADAVADLPAALNSPVGPGGSLLSGGQRQRVYIARALLKASSLTLMDEATSALDPANAGLVPAAARKLATTGAVVVVAHNLDTVAEAEQVLVIDDGVVRQQGTHAELSQEPGLYQDLLRDHLTPT